MFAIIRNLHVFLMCVFFLYLPLINILYATQVLNKDTDMYAWFEEKH
jgi:hypothetical protein